MKNTSKIQGFINGMGQILEIFPANHRIQLMKYNDPSSDLNNLSNDWYKVGSYIKSAMKNIDYEFKAPK